MKTVPYVLGMDSGGSKTVALLVGEDGTVVGSARGRGVANASNDPSTLERLLAPIVETLADSLPADGSILSAYGCLGGLNVGAVETALRQGLGINNVSVCRESSGEVVFTAAPYWGFDIAIMAGTGSIALGMNSHGDRRVVGGWGALIHDRGSGHTVGRHALQAVAEALDFRSERTELLPALAREEPFASVMPQGIDLGLAPRQMSYEQRLCIKESIKKALPDLDRPTIAGMFRLVADCARMGDAVATGILKRAGRDLSDLVCALAEELALAAPTIFAMGGVFDGGDCIMAPFEAAITERVPRANIRRSDFSLVTGAALVALQRAGLDVTDRTVARLRQSASRHLACTGATDARPRSNAGREGPGT